MPTEALVSTMKI